MRFSDGSSDVCSSDLDSEGENGGFEASGPDIAAAIPAFRAAAPQLTRIVAFGNCDAASALLLHRPLPLDALILANPWTYEGSEDDESDAPALPPTAAIRARYLARLRDPKSLLRLLKGEVDLKKLLRGVAALGRKKPQAAPDSLAARLDAALASLPCPATILLAAGDRTAQRSEEHTSELQSLMRISYAVFCLKNKNYLKIHSNTD